MSVRVALAQFSGHIDKNINVEKAENLARQAAGNGAQVVCFPELCTTIYFCFDRDKKWFETAEPVPGPAVESDADFEAAEQPRRVLGVRDRQDRHVARALQRARLAA
jgi:predicted amidohydrolase